MNEYIIIALLIILILVVLFKNKNNENKESYDPLKHEGYNQDIKKDISDKFNLAGREGGNSSQTAANLPN